MQFIHHHLEYKMPKSADQIDRAIESLKGSLAIEGLSLTEDDVVDCRAIMSGEADVDEMVSDLLDKYRVTDGKSDTKREAG